MNRREFLVATAGVGFSGCLNVSGPARRHGGALLFGACLGPRDVPLMKSVGYDFFEWAVAGALAPEKDDEWWKRQRDVIRSAGLPLRSCNGFIPGTFRLTGPRAESTPALVYAEKALRRAEEVGIRTIVFGSGGARNVPGDFTGRDRPDLEKGTAQYADFCRELCRRCADLQTVRVVIEPLRPNESNIINYVWQGLQIVDDVASPRLAQLADFFHMMMGRESADSIRLAGSRLAHCHIAEYGTRLFPGHDPSVTERLRPYFDALKAIGYAGGVSCECGWGEKGDLARNLETALKTMKGLAT